MKKLSVTKNVELDNISPKQVENEIVPPFETFWNKSIGSSQIVEIVYK